MPYVMLKLNYEVLTSKIHLSVRGHTNKQGKFDWTSAVLDAGIISGITLFTGLGTLASSAAKDLVCKLFTPEGKFPYQRNER
jgi:hypothetical protein